MAETVESMHEVHQTIVGDIHCKTKPEKVRIKGYSIRYKDGSDISHWLDSYE